MRGARPHDPSVFEKSWSGLPSPGAVAPPSPKGRGNVRDNRDVRSVTAQIIGVISDTHGLLRPEVLEIFKDVSLILHAGDIGSFEVLKTLKNLAPVVAVRGNNDIGAWANRIPQTKLVKLGSIYIFLLHDLKELKPKPGYDVVISGHSHRPSISRRDDVLFLNPGSAGPRRFKLPISVARLYIHNAAAEAELVELRG